ncbi:MAG: ferritin-like domain-containing protein [Opitutae bacterium]|nr:ferritin-like domain-containing protein [Opitutae bacterium]
MPDAPERQQLIAWLNDAHAMELSLAKVLENHAEDADRLPDIRARDEDHLAETREHARKLERCLDQLGASKPSAVKNAIGTVMGKMQGALSAPFGDEIMKNAISDFAAEHMEIACYRALVIAAEEIGEVQVARICNEILADEESMAQWLDQRLPEITRQSLHHAPASR